MFKTFGQDRNFIAEKYHKTSEPFNPYQRMAYHGWECPENTGLSVEDIKNGLVENAKKYENQSHEVQKARAIEFVLQNTRIDINEHDYFPLMYTWNREMWAATCAKWNMEIFEAFTKGYLEGTKSFLLPIEKENLPYAAKLFPYMQTVRFLADYINGDTYYKIQYPEHNLVRTKAQWRLFECAERKEKDMRYFIASC